MVRDADGDFLHPAIPPDHKLAPHVLYRIDRQAELPETQRAAPRPPDVRCA